MIVCLGVDPAPAPVAVALARLGLRGRVVHDFELLHAQSLQDFLRREAQRVDDAASLAEGARVLVLAEDTADLLATLGFARRSLRAPRAFFERLVERVQPAFDQPGGLELECTCRRLLGRLPLLRLVRLAVARGPGVEPASDEVRRHEHDCGWGSHFFGEVVESEFWEGV